jgi:hypothetical protein
MTSPEKGSPCVSSEALRKDGKLNAFETAAREPGEWAARFTINNIILMQKIP